MFQKCGFQGADWVDIPAWLMFTTQIAEGAVLAGSGPLLYLVAAQCIATGAPPAAILDTATRQNARAARRQL